MGLGQMSTLTGVGEELSPTLEEDQEDRGIQDLSGGGTPQLWRRRQETWRGERSPGKWPSCRRLAREPQRGRSRCWWMNGAASCDGIHAW